MAAGLVLAARDLVKSFGGIQAVQGIDISVADRTLHALIGPNGAGKTTAFNLLSGLYPPERGTVELEGESIAGLTPEDITAAGVGRSFQITNLFSGSQRRGKYPSRRAGAPSPSASRSGVRRAAIAEINAETDGTDRAISGLPASSRPRPASLSYGGQRLLDMGAGAGDAPAHPAARRAARRACGRRARARSASLIKRSRRICRCCWSSTTSTACSRSPITSPS